MNTLEKHALKESNWWWAESNPWTQLCMPNGPTLLGIASNSTEYLDRDHFELAVKNTFHLFVKRILFYPSTLTLLIAFLLSRKSTRITASMNKRACKKNNFGKNETSFCNMAVTNHIENPVLFCQHKISGFTIIKNNFHCLFVVIHWLLLLPVSIGITLKI